MPEKLKIFDMHKVSRILILHLHGIGNAVMFLPAFQEIQKKYPDAEYSIVTGPGGASEIFPHKKNVKIIKLNKGERWTDLFKFALRLRREKFDSVFSTAQVNDLKTPLLSFLSKAPVRVGVKNFKFGYLYNKNKFVSPSLHFVEREFELLKLLDINGAVRFPTIKVLASEERSINRLLQAEGFNLSKPIIGLHFAARWTPFKSWDFDKIVSLTERLYKRYRANLVFIGDNAEKEKVRKLMYHVNFKTFDVIGKVNTMNSLCAFLKKCSVLITTDSGPGHVASAVGTPVIVLFGPTDPNLCKPYGKNVFIVKKDLECSPCYPRYKECHRDVDESYLCMKEIQAEDVLKAVEMTIDSLQ